jgi:hypothetical protein
MLLATFLSDATAQHYAITASPRIYDVPQPRLAYQEYFGKREAQRTSV